MMDEVELKLMTDPASCSVLQQANRASTKNRNEVDDAAVASYGKTVEEKKYKFAGKYGLQKPAYLNGWFNRWILRRTGLTHRRPNRVYRSRSSDFRWRTVRWLWGHNLTPSSFLHRKCFSTALHQGTFCNIDQCAKKRHHVSTFLK